MGSDVEPAKLLLPYLQRADELQKHDPLVSYYCRLYAMEKGLKIPPKDRTKTTNSILVSLMNQLEKDKKSIKLGPDDSLHVEGFALNVFAKADKQDRAGRADLNTAKTFYAASIFFEILTQFGELQPDVEQKQKYALWKAADIRKALKEGRKPEPGPPGGEDDLSVSSSTEARSSELPRSESFPIGHPGVDISSQHVDGLNLQPHLEAPTSPPSSYPSSDYSGNFHQPSLPTKHDDYSQSYHHPSHTPERQQSLPNYHSYDAVPHPSHSPERQQPPPNYPSYNATPHPSHSPERQQPPPNYPSYDAPPENYSPQNYFSHEAHHHNYPSHETTPRSYTNENLNPPNSLPNFQSYPSFTDTTLPTAPTHNPSYHQGSDSVYSHQPPPSQNCPPPMQYTSGSGNGTHAMHTPPPAAPLPAPSYTYDSNYQPPVEKIAEAHKAARFAVGALAFDDVPVAVDFLRRSLELLTNPSAETH